MKTRSLVERLQILSDSLEEAVDHIEALEAIVERLETSHPQLVEEARAFVAAGQKGSRP